ncbi:Uma2 family endonuclease [Pedobacter sp. SD-b]|uniref:Uma2 family endonuclease n=1 Tax=Pedobacter segetis TaxID=2793069 RepID=A0ABS1BIF8_9SPHI|nr:Uma2 family endonuclease [Pedobacter segetis]MBK0382672.1 Uma2 family endonuclease [Pedobacter segetis]
MQFSDLDLDKTYSYADYLKWRFDERLELIKGKIFKMTPVPNRFHQDYTGFLYYSIYNFLKHQSCKVYIAPFDVRFPKESKSDKQVYTVLQPDICVICDLSKLDERGCIGAPDIVIEILSPGNSKKEMSNKFDVYQEHGVKEYWMVSPIEKNLVKYILHPDGLFYANRPFIEGNVLTTAVLPGFELKIEDIFNQD